MPRGIGQITAAASRKDGKITLSLANLSMTDAEEVTIDLGREEKHDAVCRMLTGEVHEHNTFEQPNRVVSRESKCCPENGSFRVTLPPVSVICLTIDE